MKKKLFVLLFVFCFFSCTAKENYEIYKHNQILNIDCQKISVFSEPFSKETKDLIYVTKDGDKIQTLNVLYSSENKKTSLEVQLNKNKKGYIHLSSNPYKNGNFSLCDIIDVKGNKKNILRNERNYTLAAYENMHKKIYELPDESSNAIFEFSKYLKVKATLITDDYKWIYVTSDNFYGWTKTDYISRDAGGPIIMSPDEQINEELLWADYR